MHAHVSAAPAAQHAAARATPPGSLMASHAQRSGYEARSPSRVRRARGAHQRMKLALGNSSSRTIETRCPAVSPGASSSCRPSAVGTPRSEGRSAPIRSGRHRASRPALLPRAADGGRRRRLPSLSTCRPAGRLRQSAIVATRDAAAQILERLLVGVVVDGVQRQVEQNGGRNPELARSFRRPAPPARRPPQRRPDLFRRRLESGQRAVQIHVVRPRTNAVEANDSMRG